MKVQSLLLVRCCWYKLQQIRQLERMNGNLRPMGLHTPLTWCDLFVKRMATTLSSLSVVSLYSYLNVD